MSQCRKDDGPGQVWKWSKERWDWGFLRTASRFCSYSQWNSLGSYMTWVPDCCLLSDVNKLYTAASLEIVQVVLYLGLHEGWVPTLSTSFHSFTVMPYRSYIHHLKSFGALIVESHLIKHFLLIHIFIYVLIINYVKMILIMINYFKFLTGHLLQTKEL